MNLRVAMVVDRFPHEPFIARQVHGLRQRGLDLHILCQIQDRTSPSWSLLDRPSMAGRIHPWPERRSPLSLAKAAGLALGRSAARRPLGLFRAIGGEAATEASSPVGLVGRVLFDSRVLAIGPDVLHFQFGDLARRRTHSADALDVAFTSSFRGYDLAYAGLEDKHYYDDLWSRLDGAHTLGQDLRQLATARGCPPGLDWTIVPPAVDTVEFSPAPRLPRQAGRLEVVSVGRLHWKKGYSDALAAIAGLRDDGIDVRYRIVGSGNDQSAVRWHIRDLGLDDVVDLVGPLNPAQVPGELAQADVLLHPALSEGFGNAVLEAQAMEVPVVCTDAEGLAENVVDGVTGFVVPRRRPSELRRCLGLLAGDEALRRRLGRAGRQRVLERFTLNRQIDDMMTFYYEVAAQRRGPS